MNISTSALRLPDLLKEQVAAAQETGLYASESELIADALRTFLAARPDVRLTTACRLYERGTVSLGKAAELADIDMECFKRALHERGIERTTPESPAETIEMAEAALRAAGRSS
jgi:predicted HTH domain antitoxin